MADRDYNIPPTLIEDINQLHTKIARLENGLAISQTTARNWKDKYHEIKSEYDKAFLIWLEMKRQAQNERGEDEANSETLQDHA